jgi:hypothetical protein
VIEEFAEPIEYDFQHELAIDMLDFFRGYRSWRQFYNFLDRLPPHGHYKTAVAMSSKWAEMVLDMEESGKGIPPGTEDHDLTPLGYSEVVGRCLRIFPQVQPALMSFPIFVARSEP